MSEPRKPDIRIHVTTSAGQLAAAQNAMKTLPEPKPLTQQEYDERQRRLSADAEAARKAYIQAKALYDGICDEMRNLRVEWQEQQKEADPATEKSGHRP